MILFVALGMLVGATVAASPAWADNDECADSEGGGGWGGVEEEDLNCEFSCNEGATLRVKIDSEDEDASVEGHAECGGEDAECADQQACEAFSGGQTDTHSHEGDCYGSTSETWDSSVTIECEATGGTEPGGPCVYNCDDGGDDGDDGDDDEEYQWFATQSGPTPDHLAVDLPDHGSRVTIQMVFPLAWGSICDSDGCTAVTPTCELGERWTCGIR